MTCASIHLISSAALEKFLPKMMASLQPKDRLYFAEAVVSATHALVLLVLGSHVVFLKKTFHKDVLRPFPTKELDVIFSTTLGYGLWDCFVMYLHGESLAMWVHHVLVILGSFLVMCARQGAFFPTIFVLTEVTAIPQNLLYVVQKLGYNSKDGITKMVLLLRSVITLIFRAFVGPAAIYHAVVNTKLTWKEFFKMHVAVCMGIMCNVTVLSIMNLYWSVVVCRRSLQVLLKKEVLLK